MITQEINTIKKISGLLILGTALLFSSCSKYEDGPVISLRSKKERVANSWYVDKATSQGENITSNYDEYTLRLEKDGDAELIANYSLGSLTYTYDTDGTWSFEDGKEVLELDMSDDDADRSYQILRLKEEELWLREEGKDLELQLKPL